MSAAAGKSRSPVKRTTSPKKHRGPTSDDQLLMERISSNDVTIPTTQFYLLGGALSILPAYIAVSIYDVDFAIQNIIVLLGVMGGVTYMLSQAYSILFFCEFKKRDTAYTEIKSQKDANLLRALRLELSMNQSLFQVNAIFVILTSIIQLYIFKAMNPLASYLLAPTIGGLVAWFAAFKSEATRQEKADN